LINTVEMSNSPIKLHLSIHHSPEGLVYQKLTIELNTGDRLISPDDLIDLYLPPGVDTKKGVVISGRAPIWLYCYLVHELHPTVWVATEDPRLGAVVVATHSRLAKIGQVISLEESQNKALCPALMIVGPPDSGKSILAHSLFQELLKKEPNIYLQRANWDGEGNYILELDQETTAAKAESFKKSNKGELTERFFPYHSEGILNLRRSQKLVIVDVGGMVQPEKIPVLEACTHYIIISSQPEAIESWHQFCADRGNLTPVAVIHSILEERQEIHQEYPYLEITAGKWVRGEKVNFPQILLEKVKELLN
jgi:CRISPR-associated protein Csx3